MVFYGFLWFFMVFYGFLWFFMVFYGFLWFFMNFFMVFVERQNLKIKEKIFNKINLKH